MYLCFQRYSFIKLESGPIMRLTGLKWLPDTAFFYGKFVVSLRVEDLHYDWEKNVGRPYDYFSFGTAATEVEIDCLTGDHHVIKTHIVMDVGDSLNPAIDVGQVRRWSLVASGEGKAFFSGRSVGRYVVRKWNYRSHQSMVLKFVYTSLMLHSTTYLVFPTVASQLFQWKQWYKLNKSVK